MMLIYLCYCLHIQSVYVIINAFLVNYLLFVCLIVVGLFSQILWWTPISFLTTSQNYSCCSKNLNFLDVILHHIGNTIILNIQSINVRLEYYNIILYIICNTQIRYVNTSRFDSK